MLVGQGHELGVAVRIGGNRRAGQHATGAHVDDRGGVGLAVGVDADDDLDELCQHGHAFFSLTGGTQQVPVRCGDGRTVMRHASSHWRSSS
jgi:hypothetical protein